MKGFSTGVSWPGVESVKWENCTVKFLIMRLLVWYTYLRWRHPIMKSSEGLDVVPYKYTEWLDSGRKKAPRLMSKQKKNATCGPPNSAEDCWWKTNDCSTNSSNSCSQCNHKDSCKQLPWSWGILSDLHAMCSVNPIALPRMVNLAYWQTQLDVWMSVSCDQWWNPILYVVKWYSVISLSACWIKGYQISVIKEWYTGRTIAMMIWVSIIYGNRIALVVIHDTTAARQ